jgi:hypothetical protein
MDDDRIETVKLIGRDVLGIWWATDGINEYGFAVKADAVRWVRLIKAQREGV